MEKKIFIGDPCYLFRNDTKEGNEAWIGYLDKLVDGEPVELDGGIVLTSVSTAHGDGVYQGQCKLSKREQGFPVDSGMLGYVVLDNIKPGDPRFVDIEKEISKNERSVQHGFVQKTSSPKILLSVDAGLFWIDTWVIDTDLH